MFVVDALNFEIIKRRFRVFVLRNEIKTSFDKRDVIVLIDTKNEKIFVLQTFIKNVDILESEYVSIMMRVIDDHKIFFYEKHDFSFSFANNTKKKQMKILKTYIVDMRKYDFIFDYF